ncbi:ABC transporter permease [Clostridium perfringens]|uniref:ABC transporter permease n=1 Tax=Clostridium perfringens TaxID=1502 RepID=UPI0010D2D9B8|nr:ABC-2 family transporter protein [Clostridium perfringens]TBX05611.1 multidrug ABC transporter permease [Clostridium perfringens]
MKNIILDKYFKLSLVFIRQYIKILIQSKLDFFLGILGFVITQASNLIIIFIIFKQIPNLNGWNMEEIIFIYGFSQIPRGIDHLFTDNLWSLSDILKQGDFDKYLIRPINPLFNLLSNKFQPDALGEIFIGITLIVISSNYLNISWEIIKIIIFIIAIVSSTVIYTSIKLLFSSFSFWIKDSFSLLQFIYTLSDFAKYPITIYSKYIQYIISIIIPFAFTSFFPACYFLNKIDNILILLLSIIVSIIFGMLAYLTWNIGIKHYESSGS